MSAVATAHQTVTQPSISTRQRIPSSKVTIRRKDGVGAMSTRWRSIYPIGQRRITDRYRASIDRRRDHGAAADCDGDWRICAGLTWAGQAAGIPDFSGLWGRDSL